MGTRDPRVDAYIAKSADFARPILTHFREVVHAACPDVVETLKWGMPSFTYKGILCGMAAFKEHCGFHFWQGSLVFGADRPEPASDEKGMGQFGRVTKLSDLPSKRVLASYVKKAAALNEAGVKKSRPTSKRAARAANAPVVPDDLARALRRNAAARKTFDGFSPSHQREYVQWITEAKRDETRERRLATTIEWLAEGKPRNWQYMKR